MDVSQSELMTTLQTMAMIPYVQAIVVILLFVLLANIVDRICSRVIVRLLSRREYIAGNRVVELLHRPVFLTVTLIGVILAIRRLELRPSTVELVIGIIGTFLVVMWTIVAYRLADVVLGAMVDSERHFNFAQPSTTPVFRNGVSVLLFLVGSYAILVIWDVNITGLVASAGILGLALSFAAQETLSNLFAGISILADRPYKVGDYIVLDSGDRGEVTHIGLRSTRLLTRDDVGVMIPNGVIARAKIVNEAANPLERYRVRIEVGVAYGSDIRRVIRILTEIARQHEEVCESPEPRVRFRTFGDSSLKFELLFWIKRPADRGRLVHELNCAVYESFAEKGISIPFPQLDVTIKNPTPSC